MGMERNSAPDTKLYYKTSEGIFKLTVKSVLQKTQDATKWVVTAFSSWIENCKKKISSR